MDNESILIEPVVSYPRAARPGELHYLTVDVRHEHPPEQWPYSREELVLTCLVETPLFLHKPLGDRKVVLHRFGGSYGPAAFLLTAGDTLQKGGITLSFVNRFGMTVHSVVLEDIEITDAPAPADASHIKVPVAREWVSFSDQFTPEQVRKIRGDLKEFRGYLREHGCLEESAPPVRVNLSSERFITHWYDPRDRSITLHAEMLESRDALFHEYAHHILATGKGRLLDETELGIECGLADYLACSFKNDPRFGIDVPSILKRGAPSLRNLRNQLHVSNLPAGVEPQRVGEVWGGAFWELRGEFGARVIDPFLVRAWRERGKDFQAVLLERAIERSFEFFASARRALQSRGLLDMETAERVEKEHRERNGGRLPRVEPDGRQAFPDSEDKPLRVRELATLEGHAGSVFGCAVTADGRRAVSASWDKTLKVWDLETGRVLATLEGHSAPVFGCAVTADGRRAISASFDTTLKVWDLETGRVLATLEGHSNAVWGCAVTLDGRRAVSASEDKTLKVWDLETGRVLATLEGHLASVRGCAVTADGRRAISASWDKTLKVWDLETGRVLATLEGHLGAVRRCAMTPDGRRAVSASADKTLMAWDLETGRALATLEGHSHEVYGCAVTADGRRAVSASSDATLKVWDLETGRDLATLEGHSKEVRGCAVTADGRRVVSASSDATLKVWDLTGHAPSEEQRQTTSDRLVHRPEEEEVFSFLTHPQERTVICVKGYFGQGVTTVLKRMAQRLENAQPPWNVLWFDATRRKEGHDYHFRDSAFEFRDVDALTEVVERALKESRRADASREQKTVVIIDNLHDLIIRSIRGDERLPALPSMPGFAQNEIPFALEPPWGMASIRRLLRVIKRSGSHALVAIRHDIPYLSKTTVSQVVGLRDLGTEQMKQLAGLHWVSLSDVGAWELLEWTGGSVRLATLLLKEAHRHPWPFEDLMRFETEEWSRVLDDSEVDRARSLSERAPEWRQSLQQAAERGEVYLPPQGRIARGLEGAGLIRHVSEGRWMLRTPFYQRVFAPDAIVRLPEVFRRRFAPSGWHLTSRAECGVRRCRIRLALFSKDPQRELRGGIRFRLLPFKPMVTVARAGLATVQFSVPAPFGPITAWAETLDGEHRLSTPIDRLGELPELPSKGTPRPARKRKAAKPRHTAKKRRTAKK